jgi:hypothetical protein
LSYILLGERLVKAARKQHKCIWCGQHIYVGDPYTYERSIFEGEPQSHHWHPECLERLRELTDEAGGEYEFNSWYEERPAKGKSDGAR